MKSSNYVNKFLIGAAPAGSGITAAGRPGMTLMEVVVALAIITVVFVSSISFISFMQKSVVQNQDRSFAIQKALAMINELRAYAAENESTGGASALDIFDDGVLTSTLLTIEPGITETGSGNALADAAGNWRYFRQIAVRKFLSYEATNVRIVTVRIYFWKDRERADWEQRAVPLATVSTVVTTGADINPTNQVYDIYLLNIENIPGWWVYPAYLGPFIENTLTDMETRNPGLEYRRHWITKSAYGRDQEYKPLFNNSVDSTQPITYTYFYPGTMPVGAAVSQYYVPGNVQARVNIDGATVNSYNAGTNANPYSLADQYNHAMRFEDEKQLYLARSAASHEEPTYRYLLDDMILNPVKYRNAIFINLHGELAPMPPVRNYSDAAKSPASYPGWRAISHPENISQTAGADVLLRVYSYLTDPVVITAQYMSVPVVVTVPGKSLTASDVVISAIAGGTDQDGTAGADDYVSATALSAASGNRMWATVSGGSIYLYNSPLRTPSIASGKGLDTARRLYGMDYIPCPVEAANDFSQNLTSVGGAGVWQAKAAVTGAIDAGGGMAYPGSGDFIYVLRGGNNRPFYRYSVSGDSWTTLTQAPANITTGGDLCSDGNANGYLYALQGGSKNLYRYNITTPGWATMAPTTALPQNIGDGGALCFAPGGTSGYLYALRGATTNAFYRYTINGTTGVWHSSASASPNTIANLPVNVGAGGSLCYVGGATPKIYALAGNSTNSFYCYTISSNSWAVMPNTGLGNITTGGSLCYDGSNFIYALQGGSTAWYRYSISGSSWTTMTPVTLAAIGAGGALAFANNLIYGLRGGSNTTFWSLVSAISPKNTARWIIRLKSSALGATNPLKIETRINSTVSGTMTPSYNAPTNLSRTYVWRVASGAEVPFSERYQFQGDPRHCPYADVKAVHGYNWFFDNFNDAAANAASEWPGFDRVNSAGGTDTDGWHGLGGTTGDCLDIDVPRFYQFLRTGLTNANCVFSTITGFSFYYMGLGGEIGYDSANGFTNSIPVSNKPFNGAAGFRYEQTIISPDGADQPNGSGVKYMREIVTNFSTAYKWWSKPWLGELYPDGVYASQWAPNGNLTAGAASGTFVRVRRSDISASGSPAVNSGNAALALAATPAVDAATLPRGTTFLGLDYVRRTNENGCTSFFNMGSSAATFRHGYYGGETGNITTAGHDMAAAYAFPLSNVEDITRPFRWDISWGAVPTEYNAAEYSQRNTLAELARYYDHQETGYKGSALLCLTNPAGSSAFMVVSGIAATGEIGTSYISKYAIMTLTSSLLRCGLTGTPSRVVQVPRVEIKEPNVTTELVDPDDINITWGVDWKRWDNTKYNSLFADNFAESESNLYYVLLYSNDNGRTWKHIYDDSPATPGTPPDYTDPDFANIFIADANSGANETLSPRWNVSDRDLFPEANYIIMVEAYRYDSALHLVKQHYSYHQQKVFINR